MPPQAKNDELEFQTCEPKKEKEFKPKIVWRNVYLFIYMHLSLLYAIYLIFTVWPWKTFLFGKIEFSPPYLNIFSIFFSLFAAFISGVVGTGYGIAAGAHRHWAHNAYRAKWPMKVIIVGSNWKLTILSCESFQFIKFYRFHIHKIS